MVLESESRSHFALIEHHANTNDYTDQSQKIDALQEQHGQWTRNYSFEVSYHLAYGLYTSVVDQACRMRQSHGKIRNPILRILRTLK